MTSLHFDTSAAVAEFHRVYGVPIRTVPVADPPESDTRIRLLAEEVQEYEDAVVVHDLIEIADALGDIVYVAYGCGHVHGLDLDGAIAELDPLTTLALDPGSYYAAMANRDVAGVRFALAELIRCCHVLANVHGFELSPVLHEVHRSNMTKMGEDGKPVMLPNGKIIKGPNFVPPDIARVIGVVRTAP